ncbi:DUF4397 domain-containing protein [Mycoplasmatota bacterium]|nr:DUF4397 domain-containing protein [Mycoplasmatota bacterium]
MNIYNPIEQPTSLRFVHDVRMAEPINITLNDRPIIRGLAYRQSTPMIPVPKGNYNVKVFTTAGNKLLLDQNLDIEGQKLVAVTTKDGSDILILQVTDEKMFYDDQMMPYTQPQQMPYEMQPQIMPQNTQPQMMQPYGMGQQMPEQQSIFNQPASGCGMGYPCQYGYQQPKPYQIPEKRDSHLAEEASVRFIHFSPNAPAVDITLPDGTVLFRNVPYKAVTDYINVAPGTYTLQVRPAGMDQVVLTVPNVVINPNDMLSIYAIGLVNGTPGLEAIVFNDKSMML